MGKRALILLGMGAGGLWALAMVPLARWAQRSMEMPLTHALALGFLPAGLVLLVMIGRLAQRRFFDDALIDGDTYPPNSGGEIDQRVLSNTVEQLALALALWPFIALVLGGGPVVLLGLSFAVTRLMFWLGYHMSPPLRALGFAAGFYPTIVLVLFALLVGVDTGVFAR